MKTTDPTLDPQTKIRVGSALCNPNLPQGGSQLFFTEIITALISNIETKARSYRKPNLQSVFLMNNYQFIHVALRGELAGMVSADAVMRCEKGLAKNREVYLDGWKPLLEHLMDVTYVQGGKVQGQLGKSQRDVIKEKFKVGFDVSQRQHCLTSADNPRPYRASTPTLNPCSLPPARSRFRTRTSAPR